MYVKANTLQVEYEDRRARRYPWKPHVLREVGSVVIHRPFVDLWWIMVGCSHGYLASISISMTIAAQNPDGATSYQRGWVHWNAVDLAVGLEP